MIAWSLPIISGLCEGLSRASIKETTISKAALIVWGNMPFLPIFFLWLFFYGTSGINPIFWPITIAHALLWGYANFLIIEAHRTSPLILTVPFLSLTPTLTLLISPIATRNIPQIGGIIGIIIITAGLYILNFEKNQKNLLDPFRAIKKERGSRLMIAVACISAIVSYLDPISIKNSNEAIYLITDKSFIGIFSCMVLLLNSQKNRDENSFRVPKNQNKAVLVYSVLMSFAGIFHYLSFRWIETVSYVIATKRVGSVVFAVTAGLILALFKKENFKQELENLKYRLPAIFIVCLGTVLVILFG